MSTQHIEPVPPAQDSTGFPYSGGDLTCEALAEQNRAFIGTRGVSQGNRNDGFEPAFRDRVSGVVYRSCFADGRPAPMHLLEGLPGHLAVSRDACGNITGVKSRVEAGFLRDGAFYTRDEAARELDNQGSEVSVNRGQLR